MQNFSNNCLIVKRISGCNSNWVRKVSLSVSMFKYLFSEYNKVISIKGYYLQNTECSHTIMLSLDLLKYCCMILEYSSNIFKFKSLNLDFSKPPSK